MGRDEFDYIVVGAGTAGCVVAEGLSRDPSTCVLLVESGPGGTDEATVVPSRWPELTDTARDHALKTTPQRGLNGRVLSWPRGAGLGGSGQINAMVQVLGARADFAQWERDGLWSAATMEFALVGSEKHAEPESPFSTVFNYADPHPFTSAFLDSAVLAGYERRDHFTFAEPGVGMYRTTTSGGAASVRRSTYSDYLQPALARSNLVVLTSSRVQTLRFDGDQCTGIEVVGPDGPATYASHHDVVLTAGTVGSPEILLRTRQNTHAPVLDSIEGLGANLRDHVQVSLGFASTQHVSVASGSNLGEAGGFVRIDLDESSTAPEVQLSFAPMLGVNEATSVGGGFTIAPAVTRPRSVGSIELSADETRIDPDYLTSPHDMEVLRQGVRIALAISQQAPLVALTSRPAFDLNTEDNHALDAFIRETAQTQYHPVGTCKAGPTDDECAVVGTDFRVRGSHGLRVVDASIIPTVPTGNINSIVTALARLAVSAIASDPSQHEREDTTL